MNWLLKRLQEPSTGAGVAILAQVAKTIPSLAVYGQILDVLTAAAATHAVVVAEAPKA